MKTLNHLKLQKKWPNSLLIIFTIKQYNSRLFIIIIIIIILSRLKEKNSTIFQMKARKKDGHSAQTFVIHNMKKKVLLIFLELYSLHYTQK